MRIGFFTDTYLPVRAGTEIAIETLRESLEAMGHEMHVFAPTMIGYRDENKNVVRFRSVRVIKKPEMRLAFPWASVGRSIKEVVETPLDIVHTHTHISMGLLARYIARKQNIPFVFTNHTDNVEYARIYFFDPLLFPRFVKQYTTWFANAADVVLVPSSKIKKLFEEYGVTRPMHILPTGIDPSRFAPTPMLKKKGNAVRARLGIPEGARVLIFVGRMSEEKNVPYLIRAFASIERAERDAHLLLVGDGKSIEKYKTLVRTLSLRRVIFTGSVPQGEVETYYAAAQVFVFASQTETQGIVILEAMASGLPVVALEDDALKDIVEDDVSGCLVDAGGSPEIFASKVRELLQAPDVLARLSRSCLETAKTYTKENQAAKLLEIYRELLAAYAEKKEL